MIYYQLIKVTINTPKLAQVFFEIYKKYHDLLNSIVTNRSFHFYIKVLDIALLPFSY